MPVVSVIVPMYNVERYIDHCINSLLNQIHVDIEVILVDDGSPDRCGEIAEGYARIDSRVKIVHQQNGGLGPARNSGIAIATGDYVGFVDGDDWVLPDMFDRLYKVARRTNADIVCGGHCTYTDGKCSETFPHPYANSLLEDRAEILQVRKNLYGHSVGDKNTKSYPVSACTNIYKKSFIESNALRFENYLSEDTLFNLDAYKRAKSIAFVDCISYCYRKDNQSSITQTLSPSSLPRYEDFIARLFDKASKEPKCDYDDCTMRVRRAAVEYCRLYLGAIVDSTLTSLERKEEVIRLRNSQLFNAYSKEFPWRSLPIYQKLVQLMLLTNHYQCALRLVGLRKSIKQLLNNLK
ncbi:glycosyltransferase family 2 protein [Olsenella profusa]|nr:glycosyltransferase [Olsenella profusa]